jgi:hypothetical protein
LRVMLAFALEDMAGDFSRRVVKLARQICRPNE